MERWQWWTVVGLTAVLAGVLVGGEVHARHEAAADAAAALRFAQAHPNEAGLASTVGVPGVTARSAPGQYQGGGETSSAGGGSEAGPVSLAHPAPGSLVAWLHSVAAERGSVRIAFLGSTATAGQGVPNGEGWVDRLLAQFKDAGIPVTATRLGQSAASSNVIGGPGTLQAAIAARPNLVFVETGALADWAQNVPVGTSLYNLDAIATRLHAALPAARIVFVSPGPVQAEHTRNATGASYTDYLQQEAAHARAKGWTYIDVHTAMADALAAESKPVTAILADPYHLNTDGMALWAQAVAQALASAGTG